MDDPPIRDATVTLTVKEMLADVRETCVRIEEKIGTKAGLPDLMALAARVETKADRADLMSARLMIDRHEIELQRQDALRANEVAGRATVVATRAVVISIATVAIAIGQFVLQLVFRVSGK